MHERTAGMLVPVLVLVRKLVRRALPRGPEYGHARAGLTLRAAW